MTMKRHFLVLALLCLFVNIGYTQSFKDCESPFQICKLKTYHFDNMQGVGALEDLHSNKNCSEEFVETNSIWLSFESRNEGTLTFTISPYQEEDDIDFILYKKSDACNTLEEIRCMQSGVTYGNKDRKSTNCQGTTGLDILSVDEFENSGCKYNDDNFLKFLATEKDETYLLLINNYDSPNGLSISFEGTSELKIKSDCAEKSIVESLIFTDVYPNPATDVVNITYESLSEKEVTIDLLTVDGTLVKNSTLKPIIGVNTLDFNIEDLANSTYLIRLHQNGLSTIRQFIKL